MLAAFRQKLEHGYSPPPAPPAKWRARRLGRLAALCIHQSPAGALKLTKDALDLLPDDIDILDLQATALMTLRKAPELLGVADEIDRIAPQDPRADLARAAASMLTGDLLAANSFLRVIETTADISILLRAGGLWLLLRRPADASRLFRLALALQGQSPDAEIGLSEAALMENRPHDAVLAVQRVLEIDPGHQNALIQFQRAMSRINDNR